MRADLKRWTILSLPILAVGAALGVAGLSLRANAAVKPLAKATGRTNAIVGADPGHIVESGYAHLRPNGSDELASFAGGCFWGTEDVFRQVPGVVATAVGFSGGHTVNPSYEDVCGHHTGHAESVLIEFDPSRVSYKRLLRVFWTNHNPTSPNRQGPDEGANYRSAIWCYSSEQLEEAKESAAEEQKGLRGRITTQIVQARPFYLAEDYHQQYDEKHGTHFCPTYHRASKS